MLLIKATPEFELHGISYPEFPLLFDKDMVLHWEAHEFLKHHLLMRGRVQSHKTWDTYGRALYDYFGFLEAADLDWRDSLANASHSIVASYRDFAFQSGNALATVRLRLTVIVKFYEYAERKRWIEALPFDFESITVSKPKGFIAHTDRSGGKTVTTSVMPKTTKRPVEILTETQVKHVLLKPSHLTHRLIFRMALQTGLRNEELRTFPKDLLQNPAGLGFCKGHEAVKITGKGSHERTILIPEGLYKALWDYMVFERYQTIQRNGVDDPSNLFVNQDGLPYAPKMKVLNEKLKEVTGNRNVSLHRLRHTFATRKLLDLEGNPAALVIVQQLLGHSSITTTEKYLHLKDKLLSTVMGDYETGIEEIWSAA